MLRRSDDAERLSERNRLELDTFRPLAGRSVARWISSDCFCRSAAPCRLPRLRVVRRLPGRAEAVAGADMRLLRRADRVAGRALRECRGRRLPFATARAAVLYDRGARSIVAAWKERGIRVLAEAAAERLRGNRSPPVEGLVFVPPDGERLLRRGHDSSCALALELAPRWQLPVGDALVRMRRAVRQRGLSRSDRRRNIVGRLSGVRFHSRGRSASWTTCTRPVRPHPRRRLRFGPRALVRSTWSRLPGPRVSLP